MTSTSIEYYQWFNVIVLCVYLFNLIYTTHLFKNQCPSSFIRYGLLNLLNLCISVHFMVFIIFILICEIIKRYKTKNIASYDVYKFIKTSMYFILSMNIFINVVYIMSNSSLSDKNNYINCEFGYEYYKSIADAIFINRLINCLNLFVSFTLIFYSFYKNGLNVEF